MKILRATTRAFRAHRSLWVLIAAGVVAAGAIYALGKRSPVPPDAPTQNRMAGALGSAVMSDLKRGHVSGVPVVTIVPRPHHFVAAPEYVVSSEGPWDYIARVPFVLYGRNRVFEGATRNFQTDLASLAPTFAQLNGIDLQSDSVALGEVIGFAPRGRPRAIVTVVIGGGGWNVLDSHPASWSLLRSLARRGMTYVNATTGLAPATGAALYGSLGTGSYPRSHGLLGERPFLDALRREPLSAAWARRGRGQALVLGTHPAHAALAGAQGTASVSALWDSELGSWIPASPSDTPASSLGTVEDLARLEQRLESAGEWLGHDAEELRTPHVRPATPAFVRFFGDAAVRTLRGRRIGADRATDLVWLTLDACDRAGRLWGVDSPEVGATLAEIDRQILRIRNALDKLAGPDGYLLAVVGDRGQEARSGVAIDPGELDRDLSDAFGDAIEVVTPSHVFLAPSELGDRSADDIARWLGAYRAEDNGVDSAGAVFAGAFTDEFLENLDARTIQILGRGDYEEGDFTRSERGPAS